MKNLLKNNKGLSLVELLVSVVILSFVMAGVGTMLVIMSSNFASSNSEVQVQESVQSTFTLVSDIVKEAQISGNVNAIQPETNGYTIFVQNFDGNGTNSDGKAFVYHLKYDATDKALYLYTENDVEVSGVTAASLTDKANHILADHVDSFSIDTTNLKTAGYAVVDIQCTYNDRSANIKQNVFLRNTSWASDQAGTIITSTPAPSVTATPTPVGYFEYLDSDSINVKLSTNNGFYVAGQRIAASDFTISGDIKNSDGFVVASKKIIAADSEFYPEIFLEDESTNAIGQEVNENTKLVFWFNKSKAGSVGKLTTSGGVNTLNKLDVKKELTVQVKVSTNKIIFDDGSVFYPGKSTNDIRVYYDSMYQRKVTVEKTAKEDSVSYCPNGHIATVYTDASGNSGFKCNDGSCKYCYPQNYQSDPEYISLYVLSSDPVDTYKWFGAPGNCTDCGRPLTYYGLVTGVGNNGNGWNASVPTNVYYCTNPSCGKGFSNGNLPMMTSYSTKHLFNSVILSSQVEFDYDKEVEVIGLTESGGYVIGKAKLTVTNDSTANDLSNLDVVIKMGNDKAYFTKSNSGQYLLNYNDPTDLTECATGKLGVTGNNCKYLKFHINTLGKKSKAEDGLRYNYNTKEYVFYWTMLKSDYLNMGGDYIPQIVCYSVQ